MSLDQEHSVIGASSMDRWSACPGSVRLSKDLPNVTSEYAKEGTQAHELAAEWLRSGRKPKFPSQDMENAVSTYVEICNKYYSPSHRELGACRGIEHMFDLSAVYPGCFGTSDFWCYWPWKKHLIVLDYKHGAGIFVSAEHNKQAQYYALGVLTTLRFQIDTIEIGIVQPRCAEEGQALRTWTIDSMDLFDFQVELIEAAERTADPNAPLIPGDQCRFCPAAQHHVCPELQQQVTALAQAEFAALPALATPEDVKAAIQAKILTYDPIKIKHALDQRDFIKAYLKTLDEFAYNYLENGNSIPGYKLVDKSGNRKWLDEEKTINMLKAAGYADSVIYEAPKLKSPAQLEKALKKSKGIIEGHAEKNDSGHALVTMDDPRPPAKPTAQSEFAPLIYDPFA